MVEYMLLSHEEVLKAHCCNDVFAYQSEPALSDELRTHKLIGVVLKLGLQLPALGVIKLQIFSNSSQTLLEMVLLCRTNLLISGFHELVSAMDCEIVKLFRKGSYCYVGHPLCTPLNFEGE